jgi:hypothetical protein
MSATAADGRERAVRRAARTRELEATVQATDRALRQAVFDLLKAKGFAPWGHDGWVRDDEGCDTCYDTAWALEQAELPVLHEKWLAAQDALGR